MRDDEVVHHVATKPVRMIGAVSRCLFWYGAAAVIYPAWKLFDLVDDAFGYCMWRGSLWLRRIELAKEQKVTP